MHVVVVIIAMCNDLWLAGSNLGFDDFFFFFLHYVLSCDQFTVFQCAAQLRAICDVTDLIETSKL